MARIIGFVEQNTDETYGQRICVAIEDALAPFQLKMVTVYYDYLIDHNEYVIVGSAVLMDGYTLSYESRISATEMYGYIHETMYKVERELHEKFRSHPPYPVNDNIILGSD